MFFVLNNFTEKQFDTMQIEYMSLCTIWHVSGLWPFAFHILKH